MKENKRVSRVAFRSKKLVWSNLRGALSLQRRHICVKIFFYSRSKCSLLAEVFANVLSSSFLN